MGERSCFVCKHKDVDAGDYPCVDCQSYEHFSTDYTETWLDKMAGWAMQSLIAMTKARSDEEWTESRIMAELSRQSYSMAEAMLAEKLKREKKEVEG